MGNSNIEVGRRSWNLGAEFELQNKLNEWTEHQFTDRATGSPFILARFLLMVYGKKKKEKEQKKRKEKEFILGGKKESLFVLGVCVCEECISYPVLHNKLTVNLLT